MYISPYCWRILLTERCMGRRQQTICEQVQWIDVEAPSRREMDALSREYKLNHHIVRDCMQPEHLPKYEHIDNVHFLILRFYGTDEHARPLTIQGMTNKIAIFYAGDFIITIHKAKAAFLDDLFDKYKDEDSCLTPSALLTQIVWKALETFDGPVNRLSDRTDVHEQDIMLRGRSKANPVHALYFIKREASIGHKVLLLMQEPIHHIYIKEGEEGALQDVKDQQLKMVTLYNQVLEDVNNLLSMYVSLSAQKTNEVMKVLTIFSVFFMPLTFIVGVYGMNFRYMPELDQHWAYPAVLLLMAVITVLIYLWFRKKRWL